MYRYGVPGKGVIVWPGLGGKGNSTLARIGLGLVIGGFVIQLFSNWV